MAEVKNVAVTAFHFFKESGCFRADDVGAGAKDEWVEVTLDSYVVGKGVVVTRQVDRPVDAQHAGSGVDQGFALVGHAFGKDDDREVFRKGVDDPFDPLHLTPVKHKRFTCCCFAS